MGYWKSESQAVELICYRHGLTTRALQLSLLHHMHGLDSRDQLLRTPKRFETHHWICDSFHSAGVLIDDVVQIFGLPQFTIKASSSIDAFDGGGVGAAFIDGDFF